MQIPELYCTPRSFFEKFLLLGSAMCSLTLWCGAHCGAWLCGMMHIMKIDSPLGCTTQSLTVHHGVFWEILTTWLGGGVIYAVELDAWFFGRMHTMESDSALCMTPQSQTTSKMSVFSCFRIFLHLWKTFYRKTPEVTKIPCTICFYFHTIIFRQHRELTIVKLLIKKQTLLSGGQLEVKNLVTHSL